MKSFIVLQALTIDKVNYSLKYISCVSKITKVNIQWIYVIKNILLLLVNNVQTVLAVNPAWFDVTIKMVERLSCSFS